MKICEVELPIKTVNYSNGPQGTTRQAMMLRSKVRHRQRNLTALVLHSVSKRLDRLLQAGTHLEITMTRIAPSNGLDEDENLRLALKSVKDGIADACLMKTDRDPRLHWLYDQRRGKPGQYAVHVAIATIDDPA